jgi:predicted dehydrogenase
MAGSKSSDGGARRRRTRREFLARSGAAALGAASATMVVPHVHAAGDETIRIALVGCGNRGTGAASQALSTEGPVVLWAMADLFQERIDGCLASLGRAAEGSYDRAARESLARRVDVPRERQFVGFDAFRHAIDSGVDVVLLTTFPHFRPEQFEYAARQGKHVFMEKPVAVDVPGIRRVLAADQVARQKNLKVVVGLQRHHDVIYRETVQRLHDGAVGRLVLLRCYWNCAMDRKLDERPEGMGEMEFQMRNRYFFTWLCGDHNVEQHVHNIDVCNWIMNAHPVEANGMGGRQYRNGREHGEIFDHHFVEYTYADGTKMFSQCRQIPGCWNTVSEHVHGTEGVAELSPARGRIAARGDDWSMRRAKANPYQVEHDVLFDRVRNDKRHNEAEYAAHSTMTAILGRMATYSGKVVTWDEAMRSERALVPDRYAWDGTPPVVPDENGEYPCAMPGATEPV